MKILILLSVIVSGLLVSNTEVLAKEKKKRCFVQIKKVDKKGRIKFSKKTCPSNIGKTLKFKALVSNSCPTQPTAGELCNSASDGVLIKNCRAEYITDGSALLSWETYANDNT